MPPLTREKIRMFVAAGVVTQGIAIFLLKRANSARSYSLAWLTGAAVLLAVSLYLISADIGWELGVAWGLTTVSLAAYLMILAPFFRAKAVGHNRIPSRAKRMPVPPSSSKLRLSLRLVSAGPLYLICALAISLLIATKPWASEITRLFTGGLLNPLIWSVGALHATVDPNLWRVMLAPILITSLAAIGYFFL